jgi:hypothetical protein
VSEGYWRLGFFSRGPASIAISSISVVELIQGQAGLAYRRQAKFGAKLHHALEELGDETPVLSLMRLAHVLERHAVGGKTQGIRLIVQIHIL